MELSAHKLSPVTPDIVDTIARHHMTKRKSPPRHNKSKKNKKPAPATVDIFYSQTSRTGDFYKIGRKYSTDKITHHGYHRFYPRYLECYRKLSAAYGMLEIGIDHSRSLKTWLDYFPRLFIYGIDIGVEEHGPRYTIYKADQSNSDEIERISKKEIKHKICFIIDDGSHIPEHQIACFDYLFNHLLLPGGTYIIEDIETSYWTKHGLYGYTTHYGYHHPQSVIEIMKNLADDVNREYLTPANIDRHNSTLYGKISEKTRKLINTITFGQNCVIITKKTDEEQSYTGRTYRYRENL